MGNSRKVLERTVYNLPLSRQNAMQTWGTGYQTMNLQSMSYQLRYFPLCGFLNSESLPDAL